MRPPDRATAAGVAAAALWVLTCARWFTTADPWRPAWLAAIPVLALAVPAALLGAFWALTRRREWAGAAVPALRWPLAFTVTLTLVSRLPVVFGGAAGAVSSDGALSGIVALHIRHGIDRHVFVPQVPYSGSLKSHLAAALSFVLDPAVAFAASSALFYAAFVAAVVCLAARVGREVGTVRARDDARAWLPLAAGLFVALPSPYLSRYSLSNDGNYVEVMALGTWALFLAACWVHAARVARRRLAWAAGLLLGLGFWCHILAVIHLAAVAAVFGLQALVFRRRADVLVLPASLGGLAGGWLVGYAPGLLWNATNDWDSFRYLIPGSLQSGAVHGGGPGFAALLRGLFTDQLPFLLGYDAGHQRAIDLALWAFGVGMTVLAVGALGRALWLTVRGPGATGEADATTERFGIGTRAVLLIFLFTNVAVALLALPQLPGNPRYLQFVMAPLAVFLAEWLAPLRWRLLFVLAVCAATVGSLAQIPGILRADGRLRGFAADLEGEGVRYCYTDFYLATKINFVSAERVICSAKLGPTTTEYFLEYRRRVEAAPEAAFVAVNTHAADALGRRLEALGVSFERRAFMKPVFLRLSRKVDPEELFPDRDFSWR